VSLDISRFLASPVEKVVKWVDDLQTIVSRWTSLPTATVDNRGAMGRVEGGGGVADVLYFARKKADGTYEMAPIQVAADATAAFLLKVGDTATGPIVIKDTNAAVLDVRSDADVVTLKVDTTNDRVTVGELYVTETSTTALLVQRGAGVNVLLVNSDTKEVTLQNATDFIIRDGSNAVVFQVDGATGNINSVAGAIQGAVIATNTLDGNRLTDNSVTNAKIVGLAGSKLTDNSVDSLQIAPDAIGTSELAPDAVDTGNIVNLAVTEGKIAGGAVTEGKIGGLAVSTGKIAANAVTLAKMDTGSVDTGQLVNLAVTNAKIADTTITGGKLVNGTITATQLGVDSVGPSELDRSYLTIGSKTSATGPVGTITDKVSVLDGNLDLVGYIPIYNSVT
jgi:hypothetical protein